jgi:putative ABC transport system permease protein
MYVGGGVGGIGSDDRDQHHAYVPLAQNPRRFISVAIKASGDALAMAPLVRDVVTGMDPNLPIYDVDSMEGVIETNTWAFSVFGTLFAMFGVIALFMSAVGLYGVMAFSVARRTQEMGIRMAMGAKASDIINLVLTKGGKQLAAGITIGLVIGIALSSPLRFVLFEVNTTDLTVYGAIVVTLVLAGTLACIIPARRATRIDLVDALKPD